MKTKKLFMMLALAGGLCYTASAQVTTVVTPKYTLVDLSNGETIDVYYDTVAWRTVNRATTQPVDFYVVRYDNGTAADTVHGPTGLIVNNLILNENGKWMFNDALVKWDGNDLKMKDRYGRKIKWENGSLKIKDWNNKYKSEKGDGAKYKEEWDKVKWKDSGETKVEVGTQKTKVNNQ